MAERIVREEIHDVWVGTLQNAALAERGKRAAFDVINQVVVPVSGTPALGLVDLGVFDDTKTGSGTSVRIRVKLHEQIIARRWVNDTVSAVAAGDLWKYCFAKDAQTVSMANTGGRDVAGIVLDVSTSSGVLVWAPRFSCGAPVPQNPVLAFVAGDAVVPDNPDYDSLYMIPPTAAASTVTLPNAAREGTRVCFVANGTANGHTVQYRQQGGTLLTAALTASKRHLAIALFTNGVWTVTANAAP